MTIPPEEENVHNVIFQLYKLCFVWLSLGEQYLEEPNPVTAGPVMQWAQRVVAIDSALREVTAAHVSELHPPSRVHGNAKQRHAILHLQEKKEKQLKFHYLLNAR